MWDDFENNERSSIRETQKGRPADLISEIMEEWMKASQMQKLDRLERSFNQDSGDNQALAQFPSGNSLLKQLGILRAESLSVDSTRKIHEFRDQVVPGKMNETEIEVVASRNQLPKGMTLDRETNHEDKPSGRRNVGDVLSIRPADNPANPIKVFLTRDDQGQISYRISDPGRTTHGKSESLKDGNGDFSLRDGTRVQIENGRISSIRKGNEQYNIRDRKAS